MGYPSVFVSHDFVSVNVLCISWVGWRFVLHDSDDICFDGGIASPVNWAQQNPVICCALYEIADSPVMD